MGTTAMIRGESSVYTGELKQLEVTPKRLYLESDAIGIVVASVSFQTPTAVMPGPSHSSASKLDILPYIFYWPIVFVSGFQCIPPEGDMYQ